MAFQKTSHFTILLNYLYTPSADAGAVIDGNQVQRRSQFDAPFFDSGGKKGSGVMVNSVRRIFGIRQSVTAVFCG